MSNKDQHWVRPNFMRNRCFRAANAFLEVSAGRPSELERNFLAVYKAHGTLDEWTWDYLRNPQNTLYARLTLGGNLKGGELVKSMVLHDGKMRLLTLRILLARRNIADTAVPEFLSSQTSALENPYSDQAMKWDAKNRVIWFCPPGSQAGCPQVRLQGGKWLDEPAVCEVANQKK